MNKPPRTKRIKELVSYSPATGVFTWRVKHGRQAAGSVAGSAKGSGGYVRVMLDGCLCLGHRLAFKYVHGRWPRRQVDHINGARHDNRLANLREASSATNNQNRKAAHVRNRAGALGVTHDPRDGRYYARIYTKGKQRSLGGFSTAEAAHAAYLAAKRKLHKGCTI